MSSNGSAQHAAFLESMRVRVLESLRVAVGSERTVAVVGLPDHNNVGDSAIWIGEREVLASLGIRIGYVATWWSYDRRALVDAVGGAPVLLHGGGNLGDRYPAEHHVREQVLRHFRDRLIVQLPQTVSFSDPARARSFVRLANRHPSLRIMVRDAESRRTLEGLGLEASVSPDLVFGLADGRSLRPESATASNEVVWVARRDIEMAAGAERYAGEPGVVMTDWNNLLDRPDCWPAEPSAAWAALDRLRRECQYPRGPRHRIVRALAHRAGLLEARPWLGRSTSPLGDQREVARLLDLLAEYRLSVGMSLLSGAGVVVTDRLHAHLLSMLVGTPSVVYDNSDHKLRRYWDTWEPPASLAAWVSGPEEAWERVRPGR